MVRLKIQDQQSRKNKTSPGQRTWKQSLIRRHTNASNITHTRYAILGKSTKIFSMPKYNVMNQRSTRRHKQVSHCCITWSIMTGLQK
jgi:hypothetical protein